MYSERVCRVTYVRTYVRTQNINEAQAVCLHLPGDLYGCLKEQMSSYVEEKKKKKIKQLKKDRSDDTVYAIRGNAFFLFVFCEGKYAE